MNLTLTTPGLATPKLRHDLELDRLIWLAKQDKKERQRMAASGTIG